MNSEYIGGYVSKWAECKRWCGNVPLYIVYFHDNHAAVENVSYAFRNKYEMHYGMNRVMKMANATTYIVHTMYMELTSLQTLFYYSTNSIHCHLLHLTCVLQREFVSFIFFSFCCFILLSPAAVFVTKCRSSYNMCKERKRESSWMSFHAIKENEWGITESVYVTHIYSCDYVCKGGRARNM